MLFKEIKILFVVVLSVFFMVIGTKQLLGTTQEHLYGPGFISLLHTNPRSDELTKAFAMYEKATGKNKNQMTFADIDTYVLKVRDDLGGGWTRESLDGAMKSLRRGR